jgi:hypothetical protein
VAVYDANAGAFDRYRGQLDAIVRSATPLRPVPSTTDDAGRPDCRPDQWRLAGNRGLSGVGQRIAFSGVLRYRGGPACHLRLGVHGTPLNWTLAVDEWCNRELGGASLRVTAAAGRSLNVALPDAGGQPDGPGYCRERGRPAEVVGLP